MRGRARERRCAGGGSAGRRGPDRVRRARPRAPPRRGPAAARAGPARGRPRLRLRHRRVAARPAAARPLPGWSTRSSCSTPTAAPRPPPTRGTRARRRARSAPKSVLELPGYAAPAWLDRAPPWPVSAELTVETAVGPVEVTVRSPAAATRRLLLAHDGPEYDALAALGGFAAALERDGRLPPFQLALAAPGARNDRYSADPDYTDGAGHPGAAAAARDASARTGPAVLMGASLGALAALHLQRRHPDLVAGLFLQSGSFFTPELDACESEFPHFARIVAAVAAVHRHRPAGRPVPTVLTCGTAEENRHNNRLMAATLRRQGYPVTLRRGAGRAQLRGLAGRVRPAPGRAAAASVGPSGREISVSTDNHIVGLLLGTEEDWPAAFTEIMRRTGPITDGAGRTHELRRQAGDHRAVRPALPPEPLAGHRPAGVLVLPPARVAEEGRADGRRVPAEQPVHLPVHGEARRLLRDDAARAEGARHRAGAVQEPGGQRPLRLHRGPLQPAVRPGRDRRGRRLPDVHEALRRRRLGRGVPGAQQRGAAPRPTTSPASG